VDGNEQPKKRTNKKEQKEPLFVLRRDHNKKIEHYFSTRIAPPTQQE